MSRYQARHAQTHESLIDSAFWLLAGEADLEGVRAVSDGRVPGKRETRYSDHRSEAFWLALTGRPAEALAELETAATHEWPFPEDLAADKACVKLLAGEPEAALEMLGPELRGVERLTAGKRELIAACVHARPSLWRKGVSIALAGGSLGERLKALAAIWRAVSRPKGRFHLVVLIQAGAEEMKVVRSPAALDARIAEENLRTIRERQRSGELLELPWLSAFGSNVGGAWLEKV